MKKLLLFVSLFAVIASMLVNVSAINLSLETIKEQKDGAIIHVGGVSSMGPVKVQVYAPGEETPFFEKDVKIEPNLVYFTDVQLPDGVIGEFRITAGGKDGVEKTFQVVKNTEKPTPEATPVPTEEPVTVVPTEEITEIPTPIDQLTVTPTPAPIKENSDENNSGLVMVSIVCGIAVLLVLTIAIIIAKKKK